jgi:hypothetical protein
MHFHRAIPQKEEKLPCISASLDKYTPRALSNIMEDPKTNRYEAVKKPIEAGGGQLSTNNRTFPRIGF